MKPTKVDEIESLLNTNAGNFNEVTLFMEDAWALIEYVRAVEGFFYTSTDQDETVRATDRLNKARKELGFK